MSENNFENEAMQAEALEACRKGSMYFDGKSVEQDYGKALEWYQKAAELGNTVAMYTLGYMYEHGLGVEQDYAKAMEWYQKAADGGDVHAKNHISILYQEGLEQKDAVLLEYYKKASGLDYVDAAYQLGNMYFTGQGVEQDYGKALKLYRNAAELGRNTNAMTRIGYMYGEGQGVKQDYEKAIEWFQKAADMGNTAAMVNIGAIYERDEDYVKALEWYQKASDQGDPEATKYIDQMMEKLINTED